MNIVFDIGGTNMRVAVAEKGELTNIHKVPTPKDPREGIAMLVRIVHELVSGAALSAVAGDFAGRVEDGVIHDATNLPRWAGTNIEKELRDALHVRAYVLNDAIIVGLGEAKRGGGEKFQRVAYLTVSTGFGGALIEPAELSRSRILGTDFPELKPRLEAQISGTAVQKKFGIPPMDLDSIEERNALADILAAGLSEIAEVWKPDVFVIGGSMVVGKNPIPLQRVQERYTAVPLKMAQLGDNGGLVGAAVLAEELLSTN